MNKKVVNGNVVDADNFALNMCAIRHRRGIKANDFAREIGITERRLGDIESGNVHIRLYEALNVCDALKMDFFTMLKGVIQDVE